MKNCPCQDLKLLTEVTNVLLTELTRTNLKGTPEIVLIVPSGQISQSAQQNKSQIMKFQEKLNSKLHLINIMGASYSEAESPFPFGNVKSIK